MLKTLKILPIPSVYHVALIVKVLGMSWPKTGAIHNLAQLCLSDKVKLKGWLSIMVKMLVSCNIIFILLAVI